MQDLTDTINASQEAPAAAAPKARRKAYAPPQIEDFGRIADLTRNNNNLSAGDYGGGSYNV